MMTTDEWFSMRNNLREPPSSRMLSTQLLVASSLGLFAILLFAVLRNRFPHVFMARLSYLKKLNNIKNPSAKATSSYSSNSETVDINIDNSNNNVVFTKSFLNISDKSFFNSIITLHRITDEEIIDFAGLDAYVFLGFFKMAIKLLFLCWLFAVSIISPIRYHYTGDYDQNDGTNGKNKTKALSSLFSIFSADPSTPLDPSDPSGYWFNSYLLIYVIFTYLFTYITCHFLINQAKTVINKRQQILGKQNSVTDRTIRLSGIPPELRSEKVLKETIEKLHIGTVEKIAICKEWKKIDYLFKKRAGIIKKLEFYWANYAEVNNNSYIDNSIANNIRLSDPRNGNVKNNINNSSTTNSNYYSSNTSASVPYFDDIDSTSVSDNDNNHPVFIDNDVMENGFMNASNLTIESHTSMMSTVSVKSRPFFRNGLWGLFGEKIDALDYYTNQISIIDEEIKNARNYHYAATPTAFITMDSVATAQTLAQAVIDPRIGFLITSPAPAPADIIWENATLPSHSRKLKIYYITVITGILGVIFIFPVGYLATLLNFKSIKKFWPDLAKFLSNHEWAKKIVIDLLPVYLYTFLNGLIPFLYVWLSSKQGFISYGEEELSVVSKNFFYVFVNLFLVFTMAGTASNYWGYLSDSKQLALQLAQSLRGLASFYVDTIVLQGIGLMPFKLLPIGRIFQFILFWLSHSKKSKDSKFSFKFSIGKPTSREIIELYQPPNFNFGLQLPHPLLTLIITLIYSVISTKILSSGLVYFIIGYYVYKYLLVYIYVHPQHSTGKVMPIIFRRIILGLLLFQLTVAGSLALEKSWILAMCLIPLPLCTLMVLWYFQEKLKPLSVFIALRAIEIDENDNKFKGSLSSTTGTNKYSDKTIRTIKRNETNNKNTDISVGNTSNIWSNNIFSNSYDNIDNNVTGANSPTSVMVKNLKTSATIDERREQNQSYDYPRLVGKLEGPWIGIENAENNNTTTTNNNDTWILVWTSDGIIRKRIFNETNQTNL